MRTTSLRYFLSAAFFLVLTGQAWAQSQNYSGYNWYFGSSNRGLRFNRGTQAPTLISNKQPLGLGGSAVASDQSSGNLLFYIGGATVYDATNAPMPNGSGLLVDNGQNQPVVITKVPDLENQYLIFHRQGGTVWATKVDMTQPGAAIFPAPGQGDVDPTLKNSGTGLTGRSEAMVAVTHANGNDFWVITHENGTNNYTVTQVTASGALVNTVVPNIGLITDATNFSYHPSGKIAVSTRENQRNVEVLNFDNATGTLTFNQAVAGSGVQTTGTPPTEVVYDTEWSPNGRYLYISYNGDAATTPPIKADVMQFDSTTPLSSLVSVLPQPNTIAGSYGLQVGPDSVIYHLYQATAGGPFLLGKIGAPDSAAAKTAYAAKVFFGNPINFGGKQFPAFAPADTVGFNLSFTTSGGCANAPTSFYPLVKPGADSLVWDFGDGQKSSAWSPVHTYQNVTSDQSFTVSVTAYLDGQASQPVSQSVMIKAFDVQITLVQDTTACSCELTYPKAPNPPPHCTDFKVTAKVSGQPDAMQWYGPSGALAGQTSATLTPVDSAGYYYLVATKGTCSTYAGVNIKEYGVQDQRANFWHFGNHAGIDFNPAFDNPPGAPKAIVGPLNTPEGCSTISDRNGQVIFSTDGQNIYNRTGVDITPPPNPPGLGGQPGATQSALIVPVPGDETLYYIFTTQEVQGSYTYELRYSLFDLKQNNGTGGVVRSNDLLFSKSTERITSNGNWLVAHEYGNNSFRAYRITQNGIGQPVISAAGSDHSFAVAEQGQGYMEFGGNNKLIVALSTPGVSNKLETFDFADSTGKVTNFRPVDLKTPAGQVYGVEYSGGKIFASIKEASSSKIVEVFFDTLGIPRVVRQKPPITVPGEVGSIQTGPDGTIYVAVNGKTALGTIQPQADTTRVSVYTPDAFALAGGTNSLLGLPNFIQVIADPLQQPGISVVGKCEDDSVSFTGTPTDPIDKFFWQISDSKGNILTTSTQQSFKYFFSNPGDYVATLELTNRCGLKKTFTQNFTIRAKPAPPTNPAQVILCTTATVQLAAQPADDPTLIYSWSTGDSTRVITAPGVGQYTATLTNAYGCSSSTTTNVFDNRPVLDLGPDQTLCQNATVADLDAGNPTAASYAWTIAANGGAPAPAVPGNAQHQAVATSVAGVFEYAVLVKSVDPDGAGPLPQCEISDSKKFTINPTPVISISNVVNPSACGSANGSFNLNITGPAGATFQYAITGPVSSNQSNLSINTYNIASLSGGAYGITVTDQVTGCAAKTTEALSDAPFTAAILGRVLPCNLVGLHVSRTLAPATPFTYQVVDATSGASVGAAGALTTRPNPFDVTDIPAGTYRITLVDNTGCSFTSPPVTVTEDPQIPVTLTPNVCNSPIVVLASTSATGTIDWSWTGPNIRSGQGTSGIQADPAPGSTVTYSVTATPNPQGAGTCPSATSITLTIPAPLTADFTASNSCAAQVTLTPAPASSTLRYQWYLGPTSGTPISTSQTYITTTGGSFTVKITDPTTACSKDSPTKPVSVNGAVSVTLMPQPGTVLCEDVPFTLVATPTPNNATFKWFFNNTEISGQTASTLKDTHAGSYKVVATIGACPATAVLPVALARTDQGLLPETVLLCPDDANPNPATRSVTLNPGEFLTYDWFKDGVSLGVTDPTYLVDKESQVGVYTVNLTNAFHCPATDKTRIVVDCEPVLVAPTAFRPGSMEGNGFGLENGAFGVMTFFISDDDFSVFIFNRWGEMVYQSNSKEFHWNGSFNNTGNLLPAGTYSYVVRYKSDFRKEDGIKEKRGGVVLVR